MEREDKFTTPPIDIPSFLKGLRRLLEEMSEDKRDEVMRSVWTLAMSSLTTHGRVLAMSGMTGVERADQRNPGQWRRS